MMMTKPSPPPHRGDGCGEQQLSYAAYLALEVFRFGFVGAPNIVL